MKERGIIMSGDNPRLIKEGRKTQTRRIVNPQPVGGDTLIHHWGGFQVGRMRDSENAWRTILCPYGVAGDRLWVKERLAEVIGGWIYVADSAPVPPVGNQAPVSKSGRPFCPSIHMPRWASRSTLEILKVRVERLQDISEEDAVAEGINVISHGPKEGMYYHAFRTEASGDNWCSPVRAYEELWDLLHGKGAWDKNPWVWVLEFRLTEQPDQTRNS